jgi:hypothetical protein
MKKNLAIISASFAIAAVAALGMAQSSSAQDLRSKYSRRGTQLFSQADTVQPIPAPGSAQPAPGTGGAVAPDSKGTSISPSSKPGSLPSQYGIVRSVAGDTLSVRMLDGTTKQVPVASGITPSLGGLQRGAIVGFDTDPSGAITKLEPAEIDKKVAGTVSSINGDQVTVLSSTGESITTPVSTATISRMGLAPGKELIVTTYKGTWASKLCCPETPPAPVSNVVPQPEPPVGAPFVPPAPKPVQGLW